MISTTHNYSCNVHLYKRLDRATLVVVRLVVEVNATKYAAAQSLNLSLKNYFLKIRVG